MGLHERVAAAAEGELPDWSRVGDTRRAHIERVASLMDLWARQRGASEIEKARWLAAAYLHDALRDAPAEPLRPLVPEDLRDLPPGALHGPATAEKLRAEGVEDEALLLAVGHHTLGHPAFDDLGKALYVADFLEPGRPFLTSWRAGLRARMPHEIGAVTADVVGARIRHLVDCGMRLRPPTVGLWNVLAVEAPRAVAP